MTHFNSPEDMSMDEIKQQLALYQRLYYNKRKEDEQKKRDASIRHNQKKKVKEYAEANNISEEELTPSQIDEIRNEKKQVGKKRGAPKYDMGDYKVIMLNA